MSMLLAESDPQIEVKTHLAILDPKNTVFIRGRKVPEIKVSMRDFMILVHYVMTNTDLRSDDPRRQLLESLKAMREVPGYSEGQTRLATDIPHFK